MASSCLAIKFQGKMNMNAVAVLVFMLVAIGHMAALSTARSHPTYEHLLLPIFQGEQEVMSDKKGPSCNICVRCLSTKPKACICLDMDTQCRPGCTECKPYLLPFDFTARYCEDIAVYNCQTTNETGSGSKHIDIKHFSVRENVKQSVVSIQHINTELMIADPMTKGLLAK